MGDKVILITGGARGLGRLMCAEAVRRGALVVVAARDPERIAKTIAELSSIAAGPIPESLVVDLASRASIEAAAAEVLSRFGRIDALVNNAGTMNYEGQVTAAGLELSIATNYLGPLLLTEALRPAMGQGSRIVNLSSSAAMLARLGIDQPRRGPGVWKGYRNYASSKLAMLVWTVDLARRLAPEGISVNALHPGVIRTGITSFPGLGGAVVDLLLLPRWQRPERGVRMAIDLALSEECAGVNGAFFWRDRRRAVPARFSSEETIAALRIQTGRLLEEMDALNP